MEIAWLESPIVIAAIGGALGIIFTVIAQRFLQKRGLFSYRVWHNRVAVSGDDDVFGSVRVTWNDNPVGNLFASNVELTNESLRDFEDVPVRVFSNDTVLLNERSEIVGTTRLLNWADEYTSALVVPAGTEATTEQMQLYGGRREYLIPVFNRGQVVRLSYLNSAKGDTPPTIWVDILHKGVKVRFRPPHNEFLGVPQPQAALVGSLVGLVVVIGTALGGESKGIVAGVAFAFGLVAQLPGALLIRAWRKLWASLGD